MDNLPDELILSILVNLKDPSDLLNAGKVNRKLNRVSHDDYLWFIICSPLFKKLGKWYKRPETNYRKWYLEQMDINNKIYSLIEDPAFDEFSEICRIGFRSNLAIEEILNELEKQVHEDKKNKYNMSKHFFCSELHNVFAIYKLFDVMKNLAETQRDDAHIDEDVNELKLIKGQIRRERQAILERAQRAQNPFDILANDDNDNQQHEHVTDEEDHKSVMNRLEQRLELRTHLNPYEEEYEKRALPLTPLLEFMIAFDISAPNRTEPIETKLDRFCSEIEPAVKEISKKELPIFISRQLLEAGYLPSRSHAAFRECYMSSNYHRASPIALGCIYSYVARKFGVVASVAILDYKTLVRIQEEDGYYFIDVERGGVQRTREDIVSIAMSTRRNVGDLRPTPFMQCVEKITTDCQLYLTNPVGITEEQKRFASLGVFIAKLLFRTSPLSQQEFTKRLEGGVRWVSHASSETYWFATGLKIVFDLPTMKPQPPEICQRDGVPSADIGKVLWHPNLGFKCIIVAPAPRSDSRVVCFYELRNRVEEVLLKDLVPFELLDDDVNELCDYKKLGQWFKYVDKENKRAVPNRATCIKYNIYTNYL